MGLWDLLFGGAAAAPPTPAGPAPRLERTGAFEVRLEDAGEQKIAVIKAVRELTGVGLAEAKQRTDAAPTFIGATDDPGVAQRAVEWLRRAGARASTGEPYAGPPVDAPVGAGVRLIGVPDDAKIAAIKAVRAASGCSLAEARDTVEAAPTVIDCSDPEVALTLLLALTDAGAAAEIA